MRWIVAVLMLGGCATYTPAPNLQLWSHLGANHCSERMQPIAAELFYRVVDKARELGMLRRWPVADVSVCIVEGKPFSACSGYMRAGCSYPSHKIVVSTTWAPKKDWRLQDAYNWRATFVHEVVAVLSMLNALTIPAVTPETEPQWVKREDYLMLVRSVE